MNLCQYNHVLDKYTNKYSVKFKKLYLTYNDCINNLNIDDFKKINYEYNILVKRFIRELLSEFLELKKIRCMVALNGSFARYTNTMFSDIDINYFYENDDHLYMIKIEDQINYVIQKVMGFKGKDKIHSMVVYLPLINNKMYDFITKNRYPIYLENSIIYNKCRANSEQLMFEMYNSTRSIENVIKYLNENDNENKLEEWPNCLEIIFDNNLYDKYWYKRNICRSHENIFVHILDCKQTILKSLSHNIDNLTSEIEIKKLKYYYKTSVFNSVYTMFAIYFRLNDKISSINLEDIKKISNDISQNFYDYFYSYLFLTTKLQFILKELNLELSSHSTKNIQLSKINNLYLTKTGSQSLIDDLNKMKENLLNECLSNLEILKIKEKKYE